MPCNPSITLDFEQQCIKIHVPLLVKLNLWHNTPKALHVMHCSMTITFSITRSLVAICVCYESEYYIQQFVYKFGVIISNSAEQCENSCKFKVDILDTR